MATRNIDCPLLGRTSNFSDVLNFSYPGSSIERDMGSRTTYLDLQSRMSSDVNDDKVYPTGELTVNVFDNECINHSEALVNNNENRVPTVQTSGSLFPQTLSNIWGLNENDIMLWGIQKSEKQPQLIQSVIPEKQLTINIESDEESMHSWRPNLMNSLSSDFFTTQPALDTGTTKNEPIIPENQIDRQNTTPQLLLCNAEIGNEPLTSKTDVRQVMSNSYPDNINFPRIDLQNHLQSQKALLNIIKYEVMNAKRRVHENKDLVEKLTNDLNAKLLFQNRRDMQKLRDENAQLRLECQCLCMEVDFYLKGEAPLGEVDERFYKGSVTQDNKSDVEIEAQSRAEQHSCNSEEQEESYKWECSKCTFANHPAISCCEMCHMPRARKENPPFLSSLPDTCYCHPKEAPKSS